jgi:hypothetical protein
MVSVEMSEALKGASSAWLLLRSLFWTIVFPGMRDLVTDDGSPM